MLPTDGWTLLAGAALALGVAMVAVPIVRGAISPKIGASDRVLLVGDSLAQGLKPHMGQIASTDKVAFTADGRVSTRVDQWVHTLPQVLAATNPTLVLVSLGTNDAVAPGKIAEFPSNAKAIVDMVHARGAKVVWLLPPKMPFSTDVIRQGVEQAGPDLVWPSDRYAIERGPDQIHPTARGNAYWAALVWRSLR